MLVSRYIAKHLSESGIKHVFGITGTSVNMCFVSLGEQEGIDYVCPMHEQAASMGADGYARVGNCLGVALGTSGPGTSNMLTGCAGAYMDSVPILYLVGQASTDSSKMGRMLRHYGFQELEAVKIFNQVTKYVTSVDNPYMIKYELEKAIHIAMIGRKGPVMLVLPENVLYADIEIDKLIPYEHNHEQVSVRKDMQDVFEYCLASLRKAKRPLILFGAGVHRGNAEKEARELVRFLNCPVGMTYPARDLLDYEDSLNIGSIGNFGSRSGNFAVQASDMLLCVGARMDRYVTGNPTNFATSAQKIFVDIDEEELEKHLSYGIKPSKTICADSKIFLEGLLLYCKSRSDWNIDYSNWIKRINKWKEKYVLCEKQYFEEKEVNPYVFMKVLATKLNSRDHIFTDSGLSAIWMGQAFEFKEGQRWHTQFSYSAMGYSLPAAIGASFALDERIICITGDGGLHMCIQELASVRYNKKPVKIFVICNDGYGLIQKTQDDYNNGHYATDEENHVPFPNCEEIARAYGLTTFDIYTNSELEMEIEKVLELDGPVFCSVHIPISKKIVPRVKGGRLDNMFPFLDEETVRQELEGC